MDLKARVKSSTKPLAGQFFFLETFNEDGTDVNLFHKKSIESLGGKVESTFGEHCTHLVWSHGINFKRLQLAAIMDIHVVSPLWIDQCRLARTKVSETDFSIESGLETHSKHSKHSIPIGDLVTDSFNKQVTATSMQAITNSRSSVAARRKSPQIDKSTTVVTKKGLDYLNSTPHLDPYKELSTQAKETLKSDSGTKKRMSMADILTNSKCSDSDDLGSDYSSYENNVFSTTKSKLVRVTSKQPVTLHGPDPAVPTATKSPLIICKNEYASSSLSSFTHSTAMPASFGSIRKQAKTIAVKSQPSIKQQNASSRAANAANRDENSANEFANIQLAEKKKRKLGDGESEVDREEEGNDEIRVIFSDKNSRNETRASEADSPVLKLVPKPADKVVANDHAEAAGAQVAKLEKTRQSISSKNVNFKRPTELVISVTGFVDKDEAERQSIIDVLRNLAIIVNGKSASKSSSGLSIASNATVLENRGDDGKDDNSNCVVMNSKSNRRTLRVLFALAKGVPVVTEEWMYASLCSQHWEAFNPFLHPKYGRSEIGKPSKIFDGYNFFILESSNLKAGLLVKLVEICGGKVVKNYLDTNFLLIGQPKDMVEWLRKNQHINADLYTLCEKMSDEKRIITVTFISESLVQGEVLKNLTKGYHYVSVPPRGANSAIVRTTEVVSVKAHTASKKAPSKANNTKAAATFPASRSNTVIATDSNNISKSFMQRLPSSQGAKNSNLEGVINTPTVSLSSATGSTENETVAPKRISGLFDRDSNKCNTKPAASLVTVSTKTGLSATSPQDSIIKLVDSDSNCNDEKNDVTIPFEFAKPKILNEISPKKAPSEPSGSSLNMRKVGTVNYCQKISPIPVVQLPEQARQPVALADHDEHDTTNLLQTGPPTFPKSTKLGDSISLSRKSLGRLIKNSKRPIDAGKENSADSEGEFLGETPKKKFEAAQTLTQLPSSPTY